MAISQQQAQQALADQKRYGSLTGNISNPNLLRQTATKVQSSPIFGGGGTPTPINSSGGNTPPLQQQQQQAPIDFDALIAPALQLYDSAIPGYQEDYNGQTQGIDANRVNQNATLNTDFANQTNTINQAKTDQSGYEKSAADEARRQYSEVQQGLQSRYGGTTGTGAFATELAGGQTIRSIADIHSAASKALAGLDDKLVQVQEIGRIAHQHVDDQAQELKNQAKQQLNDNLNSIRNQKGQLLAHKAEMAANAIQHYQDTQNQINANNTAFKQQLYLQQQQAEQQLAAARERASGITSGATATDLSSLVSGLNVPSGYSASVSQRLPGGGSISLSPSKSGSALDNWIEQQTNQQLQQGQ